MVLGIVTLIDGEAEEQVRVLWSQVEAKLGPDAVAEMNTPHTSYHVADDYDRAAVEAVVLSSASATAPFQLPAPGIGLVARDEGCGTWINLARTPQLNSLHDALWGPACAASRGTVYDRYAAPTWFPHVTLSYSPLVQEAPDLVEAMREGRLPTTVEINNVALIKDTGHGHEIVMRFDLGSTDPAAV